MVVIRERSNSDLDGCVDTLRAVHKVFGYPVEGVDDPIAFISNAGMIRAWVAEQEGRVIGHLIMARADPEAVDVKLWKGQGHDGAVATLERLFVHPEAQGMGIAAKLVNTAVEYAAVRSERLVLYALEKNTIARRMYPKLGWTFYGEFQFRWDDDNQMKAYCFVSPA